MTLEALETLSADVGFNAVGVCSAIPAPHYEAYEQWIADGYHGDMDYMAAQAELRRHPEALLPGVKSIIAVALNYNQPNPPTVGQPRIARYALGRDYHRVLRSKLKRLAAQLQRLHPSALFRPCVDSAPIFERDYSHLAGLGWFGKNTMLIDSRRGSWFFIGLLLTTLDLEPSAPSLGGCGTCRRCIDACPTGAIIYRHDRWQVDARHCISYQTIEHSGPLEVDTAGWTFGCDICQEVCPFNQPRATQPERATPTDEPDFLQRRAWPDLVELAQISAERWDELTRGSPVRRTGLEGIQRNAKANLGQSTRNRQNS